MNRVLIIEDDERLGEALKFNLTLRGMEVALTPTLELAKSVLSSEKAFEACLLDIGLPDGDGLEFCALLRTIDPSIPIIMISARHDERSVVKGLSLGADDYLRKPFGIKELTLRLEKLMQKHRRCKAKLELGRLVLDEETRVAEYGGCDLGLGRREFELLRLLVHYPGRIYTRMQLVDMLGQDELIQERTIDSHISHLRKKLQILRCRELEIRSVYGSGYRLEVTADVNDAS